MKAPFQYFGGKSRVADVIWRALGDVRYYLEPFCGSAAVLLNRPENHKNKREIINDFDCYISNFWRSVKAGPLAVAKYADFPVSHADLQARHRWLCYSDETRAMRSKIFESPDWHDAKIAGFWVWGLSCWIGHGWCKNPEGIQIPMIGRGVHSKDGLLGESEPYTCRPGLLTWFESLASRLSTVAIMCGDWKQGFQTPSMLKDNCGIFLDPPYGHDIGRDNNLYHNDVDVTKEVQEFCIKNQEICRIVLAGYEGEYSGLSHWKIHRWRATGGFANQNKDKDNTNRHRERLWFSPLCNPVEEVK